MFKSFAIVLLLILSGALTGSIIVMSNAVPKMTKSVLNSAYRSYFVGCVDSLTLTGFVKDDALSACTQMADDYLDALAKGVDEDPDTIRN